MHMLIPGDIVVALFGYSDLTGAKIRPALVVSTEMFNEQAGLAVLAAISTKPPRNSFEENIIQWQDAGLRFPSKVCLGHYKEKLNISHNGSFGSRFFIAKIIERVIILTEILKVAARSNPRQVAGAIANELEENNKVELMAIGASATNQAIKAAIIARGFLAQKNQDIFIVPSFSMVQVAGDMKTAIKLTITTSLDILKIA
jgi:stage V sporulation protein S